MNTNTFAESITGLYDAAGVMSGNLSYIQKELPELALSEDLRNEVSAVCQEFESALWDVNSEIRELEERLGGTGDAKATIDLIGRWLHEQIEAMHRLVLKLRDVSAGDVELVGLKILVEESAANILYAYKDITDRLNFIVARLG